VTEKQNYMMLLSGQQPEWVPRFTFGPDPLGKTAAICSTAPSFLIPHIVQPGPAKDIWGVMHVPVPEAAGAKIPEPSNFILKDIRQWRDVIKAPDISDIDWEAMAKKDLENLKINREETALSFGMHVGYFQNLMGFMGFSEGLCAMYEEPDEVKALMEYLCDFFVRFGEKCIDYYKPDIVNKPTIRDLEKPVFLPRDVPGALQAVPTLTGRSWVPTAGCPSRCTTAGAARISSTTGGTSASSPGIPRRRRTICWRSKRNTATLL
jgi:hypothetical protein